MQYFLGQIAKQVTGKSTVEPDQIDFLTPEARRLISEAFYDLDETKIIDYHCHVFGNGNETGCCVSQSFFNSWNPRKLLIGQIYMSASGIHSMESADTQMVERLVNLIRSIPNHGRHVLLAFDAYHDLDGRRNMSNTEFYTPNEYVWELFHKYPDVFLPSISVHPYRKDALLELEKWRQKGVRLIKWLPNAMNIDPSSPRCSSYYQKMKELDMVLLSHAGDEKAVDSQGMQIWGNPLRLRAALDHGVKVIVAHCASLGQNRDYEQGPDGPLTPNFNLFLKMMEEKKYEGLLFGDISAVTIFTRLSCLKQLLERTDLHHRLVNGSDYPLPCVALLIQTFPLVKMGLITHEEREALNLIYELNPLLYDFVVKRTIRLIDQGNQKFASSIFERNDALGLFPRDSNNLALFEERTTTTTTITTENNMSSTLVQHSDTNTVRRPIFLNEEPTIESTDIPHQVNNPLRNQ